MPDSINHPGKTREIKDADGNVHVYTIIPHPAEDALELLPKVVKILGEVAGPIINALPGGKNLSPEEMAEVKTLADVGKHAGRDIDGEQIARAFTALATEFVAAGGANFCKALLKHATRRSADGGQVKVNDAFSKIYQANYMELAQAVLFSLEINFAPSLRDRLGSGDISETMLSLVKQIGS